MLSATFAIIGIYLCDATSFSTLERDYKQLRVFDARTQPNVFGIRLNGSTHINISKAVVFRNTRPPSVPSKIPPRRTSHALRKNIHKILVYESYVMPKFEVKILQIRKIKRIGGGYPYGPKNNTILELKEPIFVVNRYAWNPETASYKDPFGHLKDIKTTKWLTTNETIEFPSLPYRLMSASVECQYCFVYWKRQKKFRPESIYFNCCAAQH
ncbi:unnamed protein product [Auanema sp. JU1783]|nr:unnamed protein product [Auanema sp. JU1783]